MKSGCFLYRLYDLFCRSKRTTKECGVTIIENLVAMSLFGISIASSSGFIIMSIQANTSARTYSALVTDVQQIVDGYRKGSYSTLLNNFGASYSSISDGQTVSVTTSDSDNARTTYSTTFTAIKTSSTSFPEAVKVKVEATQRRGALGDATYSFETVIAQFGT